MPYFTIMAELRGCYADNDSAFTIKADTRRELKQALESEARYLRDAGAVGLPKRDVAWLAAAAWKARKKPSVFPFVVPFRHAHQSGRPMGLFAYVSTRADWLEAQNAI